MITRKFLAILLGVCLVSFVIVVGALFLLQHQYQGLQTQTVAIHTIDSEVLATGTVHSQSEATLHFQTGGQLIYLPVKEGDTVNQGQTIAQLDTYSLQRQLAQTLNTYQSTRDQFDQTKENVGSGTLQGSATIPLYSINGLTPSGSSISVGGDTETNIMNDIAKHILDENQASLNNSVINVELANYALQLATLTSPINGIITTEDITVAGQNITPLTSFTVADPTLLVMKGQVAASDIDFVSLGARAIIRLDGLAGRNFSGTVIKIYPQKVTLASGEDVYNVDVQSDQLIHTAKYGQNGTVLIQSNTPATVMLIPSWLIVGHRAVWVMENNKTILKVITIGKTHGSVTEVLSGLTSYDTLITNPQAIAQKEYQML